jgi:hypothetical protein
MKPLKIKLKAGERIIAVVPEYSNGPGWSNAPAWVYIVDRERNLREECIQPDERTPEMHALFGPGNAMHHALVAAVPTTKASP